MRRRARVKATSEVNQPSDRKGLAATAGPRRVWVNELESFPIQAVGKIQCSAKQIQKTLFIDEDLYPLVLKYLIDRVDLFIKTKVIHQAGTAATLHRDAYICCIRMSLLFSQFQDSVFGFFSYGY